MVEGKEKRSDEAMLRCVSNYVFHLVAYAGHARSRREVAGLSAVSPKSFSQERKSLTCLYVSMLYCCRADRFYVTSERLSAYYFIE